MDNPSSQDLTPPVPYVKGQRFTVRSHIPPPPTTLAPGCCLEGEAGRLEIAKLHPVQRCLLHPPLPGSDGSLSVGLEIYATLRVGNHHHAQLVVVDILNPDMRPKPKGLEHGKRVVAKIYDPLYDADEDAYVNPFLAADQNYTHETAAYSRLSDLQGSLIPKYYGSFSLDIPAGPSKTRHVRLILIDFIPGSSMRDIAPSSLSQRHRQRIMKCVVDFDTLLYTRNLVHRDLYPRNIMLVNAGSDKQRVIFIDFGDIRFGRSGYTHVDPEAESKWFPGTYISPLLRWHKARRRTHDFDGWVDWDWQPWLEAEYKHTEKLITKEMREKFLPDYVLNPPRSFLDL